MDRSPKCRMQAPNSSVPSLGSKSPSGCAICRYVLWQIGHDDDAGQLVISWRTLPSIMVIRALNETLTDGCSGKGKGCRSWISRWSLSTSVRMVNLVSRSYDRRTGRHEWGLLGSLFLYTMVLGWSTRTIWVKGHKSFSQIWKKNSQKFQNKAGLTLSFP